MSGLVRMSPRREVQYLEDKGSLKGHVLVYMEINSQETFLMILDHIQQRMWAHYSAEGHSLIYAGIHYG
jgi:hypothetical protein